MPQPLGPVTAASVAAGKEALKPVSSFADALAAPWITRLRRWAADRDLASRLEDPALPNAFASYARRLSERVSVLSTVIAREPLPLSTVYEPLALFSATERIVVPDAELRREGARSFVVDGAGMGKSTFARHLITQAFEADDLVPVLLELRRVEEGVGLNEAIARQFDDFDRPFDRDLLLRLFSVGRFFFVLDGLDEVAAEKRATLLSQIEELAVGAERSALVLTSRPETALPSVPGARAYRIRPLTIGQAESLVRRYDKALGDLDIGERLIAEFTAAPDRFWETPLLVALLYRTFGYTNSVSTKVSIFYDELYNALYKGHDLTKSGYVRPKESGLDVSEFRRLLRGFAFLLITNQKNSLASEAEAQQIAADAMRMTAVASATPATLVDDLLAAVPLLVRDGSEIRFVHKSVAEFFAAEFLSIGNPVGEQLITDILNGPLPRRFVAVFDFIAELDPSLWKRSIVAPLAEEAAAFDPEERNPLLRSLSFVGEVYIGFWPGKIFDGLPESPIGEQEVFVHLHEKFGLAVAHRPRHEAMSALMWQELSSPISVQFTTSKIREIPSNIPAEVWLSIKDPRVIEAAEDLSFQQLLAGVVSFIQPGGRVHMARVLDKEKVQQFTASVQEEYETRAWLRTIFAPRK